MNFSVKNPQRKSSMCYFYTRNYKNKRMAGGARCAQPGLAPTATGFMRRRWVLF